MRALAVVRRRVDAQLAVLGDNTNYLRFLENLAHKEGVGGQVHGLGWLAGDDLRQAFGAADVIATPSVYPDPFNLMNIEAMAHARPVVATCYGGAPEIVVHGETGFIADPWDEAAFGDRLATVLTDRALAQAHGRRRPAARAGPLHARPAGARLPGRVPWGDRLAGWTGWQRGGQCGRAAGV